MSCTVAPGDMRSSQSPLTTPFTSRRSMPGPVTVPLAGGIPFRDCPSGPMIIPSLTAIPWLLGRTTPNVVGNTLSRSEVADTGRNVANPPAALPPRVKVKVQDGVVP